MIFDISVSECVCIPLRNDTRKEKRGRENQKKGFSVGSTRFLSSNMYDNVWPGDYIFDSRGKKGGVCGWVAGGGGNGEKGDL